MQRQRKHCTPAKFATSSLSSQSQSVDTRQTAMNEMKSQEVAALTGMTELMMHGHYHLIARNSSLTISVQRPRSSFSLLSTLYNNSLVYITLHYGFCVSTSSVCVTSQCSDLSKGRASGRPQTTAPGEVVLYTLQLVNRSRRSIVWYSVAIVKSRPDYAAGDSSSRVVG